VPLKKIAEHGQIQGLSETPWTGNENYLGTCLDCLLNKKAFVNKKKIAFPQLSEVAYAYSYLLYPIFHQDDSAPHIWTH
jgi:hypothetical protein